jgi:hypothetical protein
MALAPPLPRQVKKDSHTDDQIVEWLSTKETDVGSMP